LPRRRGISLRCQPHQALPPKSTDVHIPTRENISHFLVTKPPANFFRL
jgi:hypothetical protein